MPLCAKYIKREKVFGKWVFKKFQLTNVLKIFEMLWTLLLII